MTGGVNGGVKVRNSNPSTLYNLLSMVILPKASALNQILDVLYVYFESHIILTSATSDLSEPWVPKIG